MVRLDVSPSPARFGRESEPRAPARGQIRRGRKSASRARIGAAGASPRTNNVTGLAPGARAPRRCRSRWEPECARIAARAARVDRLPNTPSENANPVDEQSRLDALCVNTIRALVMDAVEQANSGHPGAAMALAPVAYTLFTKHLRYNPANPHFANRDRFVLSAGHASMLLYATLHLAGYELPLDEIKRFRQLGGKCPGHPECGCAPGVETTTGPLGQGAANSVGMAIAERWLAARFNRPGHGIVGYRVFALCGDGCMMEGVTAEAASLAGHLGLSNLIWIYDDNRISIDGPTSLAFTEDVGRRFDAYGWRVVRADAEAREQVHEALTEAIAEPDRPTLVMVRSVIAYGAPTKAGTAGAHGEPLGPEEVAKAKEFFSLDPDSRFLVSAEVRTHMSQPARDRGERLELEWSERLAAYSKDHPDLARQWASLQDGKLPDGWDAAIPTFGVEAKGMATRAAGGQVLQAIAASVPWLIGGAADLTPSTKTYISDSGDVQRGALGNRNLRFGVREHAMAAICSGMALSKLRPFAATFLVFADYCRPSIRLAAMMKLPVIYVFTHDSIGVGEDGPTHQPVEQLASLRAIPNLDVVRPCDANEVSAAWRYAMQCTDRPVALALSRQAMPVLDRSRFAPAEGLMRGAYVLADGDSAPDVILLASGSEVHLCVQAFDVLRASGVSARVVSMPCCEQFERQAVRYRAQVLPEACRARVAVEAGVSFGWQRYVGAKGAVVGIDTFGESAPCSAVMEHFGFTVDAVVDAARRQMDRTDGE
ncbi:MAG: transketolase [Phycisphaerales bacterium]|nr:MAG: transketolase [Phycisphaerales bacterium]